MGVFVHVQFVEIHLNYPKTCNTTYFLARRGTTRIQEITIMTVALHLFLSVVCQILQSLSNVIQTLTKSS